MMLVTGIQSKLKINKFFKSRRTSDNYSMRQLLLKAGDILIAKGVQYLYLFALS